MFQLLATRNWRRRWLGWIGLSAAWACLLFAIPILDGPNFLVESGLGHALFRMFPGLAALCLIPVALRPFIQPRMREALVYVPVVGLICVLIALGIFTAATVIRLVSGHGAAVGFDSATLDELLALLYAVGVATSMGTALRHAVRAWIPEVTVWEWALPITLSLMLGVQVWPVTAALAGGQVSVVAAFILCAAQSALTAALVGLPTLRLAARCAARGLHTTPVR